MAFKRALEKCSTEGGSVKQNSANSLLSSQAAPQPSSPEEPRELLLKGWFHLSVSLAGHPSSAGWLKHKLNGNKKSQSSFVF